MLQKEKVPTKLVRLLREKRFVLDCNNLRQSQYHQYNAFKDKYVGYIVSCPCSHSLANKCRIKHQSKDVKNYNQETRQSLSTFKELTRHSYTQVSQPFQQSYHKQKSCVKEKLKRMARYI